MNSQFLGASKAPLSNVCVSYMPEKGRGNIIKYYRKQRCGLLAGSLPFISIQVCTRTKNELEYKKTMEKK